MPNTWDVFPSPPALCGKASSGGHGLRSWCNLLIRQLVAPLWHNDPIQWDSASFQIRLDNSAGRFGRALQYAFYDWTHDMPWSKRVLTIVGLLIQLSALVLPQSGPSKPFIFLALLIYMGCAC
jgi:hypothetical protein